MEKRTNASRVVLDWRRLLGFDQASSADGTASVAPLSPKIGPKEARGFNNPCTLALTAAKVGLKPNTCRDTGSLGCYLDAKVGVKDVRFGAGLPISVTAKIGFKPVTA